LPINARSTTRGSRLGLVGIELCCFNLPCLGITTPLPPLAAPLSDAKPESSVVAAYFYALLSEDLCLILDISLLSNEKLSLAFKNICRSYFCAALSKLAYVFTIFSIAEDLFDPL